jgi:hypothetical protein
MQVFLSALEKVNIKNITLEQYLLESLKSDPPDELCRGWEYLRKNLTPELKAMLSTSEYQSIIYNAKNEDYIISKFGNLLTEAANQISAFVFVWKDIKRNVEEAQTKKETEEKLLSEGFRKINSEDQSLHGLKVKCFMGISHIGLLGSFNKQEEKEGRLIYSSSHKRLMLLPKRCSKRGFFVSEEAFIKEIQ